MKGQEQLFSSNNDEWTTPKWLFDYLNHVNHYDTDLAADDNNHLCDRYFTAENSALTQDWIHSNSCFVNPPFSLNKEFVNKIVEQLNKFPTLLITVLIPSRTDTRYFHNLIPYCEKITFIKGRLKFGNAKNGAPFPTCLLFLDGMVPNYREDFDFKMRITTLEYKNGEIVESIW